MAQHIAQWLLHCAIIANGLLLLAEGANAQSVGQTYLNPTVPDPTTTDPIASRNLYSQDVATPSREEAADDASTVLEPSSTLGSTWIKLRRPFSNLFRVDRDGGGDGPLNNADRNSYFEADYLAWWGGQSALPPLLTTNPDGTPITDAGPIGSPGSQVLIGNDPVGDWIQSGLRLRYGRYRPGSKLAQWELGVWHLFENVPIFFGNTDDSIQAGSATNPIFARPFFNTAIGQPDAQILSYPGVANGYFRSQYARQAFGVDPLLFFCLNREECRSLDFLTGYRWLWLKDRFWLDEQVDLLADPLTGSSATFRVQDSFQATNSFHTIPIGLSLSRRYEKWSWNLRGEMGLGFVHQTVRIRGSTDVTDSGGLTTQYDGGLLALQTNSGSHDRYRFAWVPQLSLNAQRRLSNRWSATAGYTLINLNNAVKAADHIPTAIDPANIPPTLSGGGPDPRFAFADESLWIHGFNFGLRADY
jgi:hypothetical protein